MARAEVAYNPWMPLELTDSAVGERVGPYRIERLLGRGGMGRVFLAVREDDYQQKVALKLVSPDAGGEEIIARFYTERQILAGLQHPGIARLLDGGVSDDGWPYIVMEYVEGERIDRYCDHHQLSLRERLELFRRVCHAVQFAHQNLVVHRDIKPGNILMTAEGHPRLLDFGIAKVLDSGRPDAGLTMSGLAPMTPSYASPEQIRNQPITTACDVYALGMLLYRLLTGRPAYRLEGLGFHEIVELICHQEPEKPSAAVLHDEPPWQDDRPTELTEEDAATVSFPGDAPGKPISGGSTSAPHESRRLSRRLAGDLDAIVAKALRKEPRDRYGSAAELSEDLRRHLVGLPVLARRGTWLYKSSKFLRRNRLGLTILLVIFGFAVSTTFLWRQAVEERAQAERERERAEHERERAEHQQTRAEDVTKFLERLFTLANPDETQGKTLTVYEILRRGKARVAEELAGNLETQAEIFGTLASVHGKLGLYDDAVQLRRQALNARRASSRRDRPELAKDISNLAFSLFNIGDFQSAETYFREALTMAQQLGDDQSTKISLNLASAIERQGQHEEAEERQLRVLRFNVREHGPESPEVAQSLYSLGILNTNLGNLENAESFLKQALEIRSTIFDRKHTQIAELLHSLGLTRHQRGDLNQALADYEEALSIRRELFGDDHVKVAHTQKNLAALHLDRGETEVAGRLIDQALTTLRRSMPEDSSTRLDAERILGSYLLVQGRYLEAESYLTKSYRNLREIRGPLAQPTRDALSQVIALYDAWDRPDQAAEYRTMMEQTRLEGLEREKGN